MSDRAITILLLSVIIILVVAGLLILIDTLVRISGSPLENADSGVARTRVIPPDINRGSGPDSRGLK